MTDVNRTGPLPQGDIRASQRRDLADTQTRLQHELNEGVVAPGQAMGAFAGGAQQGMHLGGGQADRLAVARQAHGFDVAGDVGGDSAAGLGPTQEASDGFEASVDGGRFELALGEHVLTPGDDVVFGQPGQVGLGTVQVDVPSCEIEQVVAVAATGGSREILGGKTVEEGLEPGRGIGHRRSCLYCTQFRPPG